MTNKSAGFLSGTDLLHADDKYCGSEVSPSISVTTTFRIAPGVILADQDCFDPTYHGYSRYTQDVRTRVEKVLSKILKGNAMTYASGLAAAFAALMLLNPQRIAITEGYMGVQQAVQQFKRIRGGELEVIDIDDEFQDGDVCWIETPMNPTGESRSIKYYADKVHAVGGRLIVDSTFGPPPLQEPFKWGADIVMHSATKYLGGHSDLLGGVLVVKTVEEWNQLFETRTQCGNVMGSFEAWLLLRSLRTLHLRVPRQSQTGTALANWLKFASGGNAHDGIPAGLIEMVYHSSFQKPDAQGFTPEKQMEGGYNASFSIVMTTIEQARALPHALKYFVPATSLGGVESLIEHRLGSDPGSDPRLVRLSVGVEELDDLKDDLRTGLQSLVVKG
ncbi:cystathionine gamma-synthase [Thelephora ganbajun]|uniref:Cystathionine gamma-synthase n=1 Tax=Thelephora ganbajun TaxID=370292 RepID=A0ACB6ZVF3_THEGA|nr:cystathionine gamma-synthase [Thelephora ganbajun]